MKSDRIQWVDIYKGIAIILVVIGHSSSPINGYIYLFHMPAFFFISGYTNTFSNTGFGKFLWKKTRSLLFPFFSSNILFLIILQLMRITSVYDYFYNIPFNILLYLKLLVINLRTTDFGGATWFLIILFETMIVAYILYNIIYIYGKQFIDIAIVLIMYITGYYLYHNRIIFPYLFDLVFYSLFYLYIGNIIITYKITIPRILHIILIPFTCFMLFYYMNNYSIAQMNWPARQFGSPINNIVASLSGIYLTVVMSILLEKVELLKHLLIYIGNRTIIILILHFLIFRIIYVLMFFTGIVGLDQLKSQILLPGNNYWYILTIFSILIILLLDYFIQKSDFLAFFLLGRKTPEYEKKIKNILAGIFRLRYKTGRNK